MLGSLSTNFGDLADAKFKMSSESLTVPRYALLLLGK